MAKLLPAAAALLLALAAAAALAASSAAFTTTVKGAGKLGLGGAAAILMRRGGSTCEGTVGECMDYFGVDAEVEGEVAAMAGKRRVLQSGAAGYISYDALHHDSVPCSKRGTAYYNCQAGGESNPYSRGCSVITQCRG